MIITTYVALETAATSAEILTFPEAMGVCISIDGELGYKSLTLPNEHSSIQTDLKEFRVECCEERRKLEAMCRGCPFKFAIH